MEIFYTKKDGCVDRHIERESQVIQIFMRTNDHNPKKDNVFWSLSGYEDMHSDL
jgi:hypothetical protein